MKSKGQLSIIAALLVAVVLVATVVATYSTIRNNPIREQPPIQSAIDETNFAMKQILGFTVGYYGSVLKVTGNSSYAKMLATDYLRSGLDNIANMHPEWATSLDLRSSDFYTHWFTNASSSRGNLSVAYNLTGLGISGVNYVTSCKLEVFITNTTDNRACLKVIKDEGEPMVNLGKRNFKFFRYETLNSTWELVNPSSEPVAYANGTYQIGTPAGVDVNCYLIQVEDPRGIIVVASSYSIHTYDLTWPSAALTTATHYYLDNSTPDVDSSPDKGIHSNFTAQQYGPDSVYDTLAEEDTATGNIVHENSAERYSPTGRTSYNFNYALQKGVGNERLIVVTVSWEDNSQSTVSSLTFNGIAMTRIDDISVGVAGATEYVSLWYLLDSSLPIDSGSYNIAVTASQSILREIYVAVAEYSGVKQAAPDDSDTSSNPASGNVAIDLTATANGSVVVAGVGEGGTNALTNTNNISNLQQQLLTSSGSALGHHMNVVSGDIAVGWNNLNSREAIVGAVWQPSKTNYELDLEVQWKNVNYTDPDEKYICIKTGTLDSEALRVDVWNGDIWTNVLDSLAASSWNNASVSSYVKSSTFTIRFKGSIDTSDPVQSSWQIDATLLRLGDVRSLSSTRDTITVELLQNGSMIWLGQNLELTTQAKPIPPLPVRSMHLNQTINGVNCEVPFQIEDWASDYQIPLGLTGNQSVFSGRTMLVFLANSNVSKAILWWNGSDLAAQTSYAYVNRYFTGDSPSTGKLTNGILTLQFGSGFALDSSVGTSSCRATFMRVNRKASEYGSGLAYAITNGIVRDVIHQEPEWGGGVDNCPNFYAHIVITLPANVTYYTYALRMMFVDSNRNRNITDLCPITLETSISQLQTENGTMKGYPIIWNGTGLLYNFSAQIWAHHWSQFISGTKGAGIIFTDKANQQLYVFDNMAGKKTGCLRVDSTAKAVELLPVTMAPVNFTSSFDVTWHGAVTTFDNTIPIYQETNGEIQGSWISVEYPPTVAVNAEN